MDDTMSRVDRLIELLRLEPHPEGGWYREVFRSAESVQTADGRGQRSALTTIYFLLPHGAVSRFHRVRSDEAWHFHEGSPLRLTVCEGGLREVEEVTLGPLADRSWPVHVVRAGCWQAAEPLGDYTLVGCTVGPGFDFSDFDLLHQNVALAARLAELHPHLRGFV